MTNEMAARLMAKLYTLIASMSLYVSGPYGGLYLEWDEESRALKVCIEKKWYTITTLAEGVDVNRWIYDGRRNWRTLKKFTDGIIDAAHQWDIDFMFTVDEEGSLFGEVQEFKRILEADELDMVRAIALVNPAFNRERAEELCPDHPLFAEYDALYARLMALIDQAGAEEVEAPESSDEAYAEQHADPEPIPDEDLDEPTSVEEDYAEQYAEAMAEEHLHDADDQVEWMLQREGESLIEWMKRMDAERSRRWAEEHAKRMADMEAEYERQRQERQRQREEWERQQRQQQQESSRWANDGDNAFDRCCKRLCTMMGIELTKDEAAMKKEYRRWMMKNHPDKNPSVDQELVSQVIGSFKSFSIMAQHYK